LYLNHGFHVVVKQIFIVYEEVPITGCDTYFEVIISNFKSCDKCHIYLALDNMY